MSFEGLASEATTVTLLTFYLNQLLFRSALANETQRILLSLGLLLRQWTFHLDSMNLFASVVDTQ